MKILVIGGSGYIGSAIVPKLKNKHKITILSRNPVQVEGVNAIKGSVTNKEFLLNNVKNFDLIIYLAAVIRTSNKSKYKENIIGAKNIIEVMKANKISKIIYFSTHNVYNKKTGFYGNSKKICEKLILESGLEYAIVRPNYVYGIDKKNDIYRLSKLLKSLRICLVIGSGNTKIQPVNKEDVADQTSMLVNNFKPRAIIDMSGEDIVSFNEMADIIQKKLNKKCFKVRVPLFVLKLFKFIIPFDVDGFTEDRLTKQKISKLNHNIYQDLEKIIALK